MDRDRPFAPRGEHPRELPAADRRQEAHRGPERRGAGARAGTLETDLAQVKLRRGEVRVRRVVLVQPPDGWIAEEDATAAVGLEPVLVRVDDDRVRLADPVVGGARLRREAAAGRNVVEE